MVDNDTKLLVIGAVLGIVCVYQERASDKVKIWRDRLNPEKLFKWNPFIDQVDSDRLIGIFKLKLEEDDLYGKITISFSLSESETNTTQRVICFYPSESMKNEFIRRVIVEAAFEVSKFKLFKKTVMDQAEIEQKLYILEVNPRY